MCLAVSAISAILVVTTAAGVYSVADSMVVVSAVATMIRRRRYRYQYGILTHEQYQ
jgi:hypothetical protein